MTCVQRSEMSFLTKSLKHWYLLTEGKKAAGSKIHKYSQIYNNVGTSNNLGSTLWDQRTKIEREIYGNSNYKKKNQQQLLFYAELAVDVFHYI